MVVSASPGADPLAKRARAWRDGERAKEIYARLGFSAVWTTLSCLRQLDPP